MVVRWREVGIGVHDAVEAPCSAMVRTTEESVALTRGL